MKFERTVFVCQRCGRGWLKYPGPRDPEPFWVMLDGQQGEDCFGEIKPRTVKDENND